MYGVEVLYQELIPIMKSWIRERNSMKYNQAPGAGEVGLLLSLLSFFSLFSLLLSCFPPLFPPPSFPPFPEVVVVVGGVGGGGGIPERAT